MKKSQEEIEREESEKKEKEDALRLEESKKDEEKKKEEAYQAKLLEQERKANAANEKISKLEGTLEAIRSFQQNQGDRTVEWTKEQWEEFEEKTGLKKETLSTIDNVFGAKLKAVESKFEERARMAEEKARIAEEKYNTYEGKRSFEKQTSDYLSKKPQYRRYEKEFNDFINDYPEDMRRDPVKLASLFDKAETYIRGKVGDKEMRRTSGGSERFGSDDGRDTEDEFKADLSDLRSHERLTIEKILPTKDREKTLKAHPHFATESGVMMNTKEEFDQYNKRK